MTYAVYSGHYPFNVIIGAVDAPADRPDLALAKAIKEYKQIGEPSPVVEPVTVQ